MPIRLVSPPAAEQITLAEARLHLRLDDDGDSPPSHPDDAWLTGIGIPAAREYCEGWLGLMLAPTVFDLAIDSFGDAVQTDLRDVSWRWSSGASGGEIPLPFTPIVSVTSVRYYNADGNLTTLATSAYHVDDFTGRIVLVDGTSWPTTSVRPNAVLVRYIAGYSLVDDSPNPCPLPYAIKAAMLLVLGGLYEAREDQAEKALYEIPLGAKALMMPYRVRLAMA